MKYVFNDSSLGLMEPGKPVTGDSCCTVDENGKRSNSELHRQMCELDEEGEMEVMLLARDTAKGVLTQEQIDYFLPLPGKK